MRNLKKFLALVLAMMMAFSLMLTVNAASFNDAADISDRYEEAVEVLYELGILKGGTDGNYDPTGTLTRQQLAAILYRIHSGDAAELYVDDYKSYATTFSDVKATDWFAGQVGYCVKNDLLVGDGTNYWPNGKLTSTEVLIGLLRALGYDKKDELKGANAGIQALITGTAAGILGTVGPYNINDTPAAREMVAQLTFDTLMKGKIVTYRTDRDGYYDGNDNDAENDSADGPTLGYTKFDLKRLTGSGTTAEKKIYRDARKMDEFGRPKADKVYTAKNNTIVIPIAAAPVITFEGKMKAGEAVKELKALGIKNFAANGSVEVYQNGVSLHGEYTLIDGDTIDWAYTDSRWDSSTRDDMGLFDYYTSANNSTIEVYVNDDNEITTVVIINEFAYQLKKSDVVAAKGTTEAYIKLPSLDMQSKNGSTINAQLTYETDEFEVGDVVVYTHGLKDAEGQTNEKAIVTIDNVTDSAFTGTLTKVDVKAGQDTIYTIDGKTYVAADNGQAILSDAYLGKASDDLTYYLNSKGQIVYVDSPVAPKVFGDYAIVLDGDIKAGTWPNESIPTVQVQLLTSAGEVEVYSVPVYSGKQLSTMKVTGADGKTDVPDNYKGLTETQYFIILENAADAAQNTPVAVTTSANAVRNWNAVRSSGFYASSKYTPVKYTVSGSNVRLYAIGSGTPSNNGAYESVITSDASIDKKSTSVKLNFGGANVFINSGTVFILGDGEGGYTTVTGPANLGDTTITRAANVPENGTWKAVNVVMDVTVVKDAQGNVTDRTYEVKYIFAPWVDLDEGDAVMDDTYYFIDPANYLAQLSNEDKNEYYYTAIDVEGGETTVMVTKKVSTSSVYQLSEDGKTVEKISSGLIEKKTVGKDVGNQWVIGGTGYFLTSKTTIVAVDDATPVLQEGAEVCGVFDTATQNLIALWVTKDPA